MKSGGLGTPAIEMDSAALTINEQPVTITSRASWMLQGISSPSPYIKSPSFPSFVCSQLYLCLLPFVGNYSNTNTTWSPGLALLRLLLLRLTASLRRDIAPRLLS